MTNIDIRNINSAHYRRGDKVSECESSENKDRLNCKNITEYVKYVREKNGVQPLYLATNEKDPIQLQALKELEKEGVFSQHILADAGNVYVCVCA